MLIEGEAVTAPPIGTTWVTGRRPTALAVIETERSAPKSAATHVYVAVLAPVIGAPFRIHEKLNAASGASTLPGLAVSV